LFTTSHIPTTTASVTRNADDVRGTLTGEITRGPSSYYFKLQKQGAFDGNRQIFEHWAGTTADRAFMYVDSGADLNFLTASSGGDGCTMLPNLTLTLDTDIQAVVGFAENDSVLYVDGNQEATDTTCALLNDDQITLFVGQSRSGTAHLNGLIKEIRYYDTRLTNEQLLDLSNGIFPSFGQTFVGDLTRGLVRDLVSNLVR
jgi:hypothetical protein